jgi:hypothetical protein
VNINYTLKHYNNTLRALVRLVFKVFAGRGRFKYCWRWFSADRGQSHASTYFEDEISAYYAAMEFADGYEQQMKHR